MDNELLEKMKVEELKNYLKTRGLKVTETKKELVARVFSASEWSSTCKNSGRGRVRFNH